jgi:hypothetical protein
MVQPIQYTVKAPSAFESLVSGLKLGTSLQEVQAQRALREQQALQIQQKMAEEKRVRERMAELNNIPPHQLSSRLGEFSDVLPHEMFNALRSYASTADEKTLRNQAGQLGQLIMAAGSNDTDVLESVGQELISAAPDEASKKAISAHLESARKNPKQFVIGQQIMLRQLGEVGVKIADNIEQQLSLKPGALDELRQKVAQADQAVAQAKTAQATAQTADEKAAADLKLANANAARAQVQADYENRQQKADLDKKAQDLGLTAAQKNKVLAETSKLSAETKKIALELAALEASGGVDPSKKFDQEEKLRKEFTARTKVFNELDSTFSNLKASEQAGTGPGDIALITGFMKMLDPGSVVRETEFATARDTAGLFTKLENSLQKLQNGEFLKPAQRKEYINLAEKYYDAAKQKANIEKQSISKVVTNYKLNPDNVFGVEAAPVAPVAPGAAAPAPAPTPRPAPAPPTGGRNIGGGFRVLD